jgi:hypothetical protein
MISIGFGRIILIYIIKGLNLAKIKEMIVFVLIVAISCCLAFILVYSKRNLFVTKEYFAAPNTTRGFALLADFIVFNSMHLIFILAKFFLVPEYQAIFSAFADHVFHNGGHGLGLWFWKSQAMLMVFYIPYSLLTELSPMRATLMSKFFGLRIEIEEGHSAVSSIFIRNMIKPICIVFFPVFMFLSYLNANRKWLHDQVSNTKVLREQ